MRVGIVGFPFSGKTALFRAITGLSADQLELTKENLAAVKIPEPRLDFLEQLYKPKKRTEATIEFVDLPGSAEGDGERAGLDKHLTTLRQADALCAVVRSFESSAVPLHKNRIDPRADVQELREEMLLADLVICSTRVERLEKAITKPTPQRDQQKKELELLQRCQTALESEQPLRDVIQPDEEKLLRSFGFLTQKPLVVVVNVGEDAVGQPPSFTDEQAAATFAIAAELEAEIMQLEDEERPAFMQDYGITELARDTIIRACFDALGLIVFLTAGEDEVRAWPIRKGMTAPEAAGKIHSDLERGFIRAETVAFDDLKEAGDMRAAKAANKVRQEPKPYVVQDGDIMNIKFNV
jgi:hypothetical protein